MLEPFVEQTYQSLGNNIYRFRILEQMSQVRLAEKSNISAGYISQIECAHPLQRHYQKAHWKP